MEIEINISIFKTIILLLKKKISVNEKKKTELLKKKKEPKGSFCIFILCRIGRVFYQSKW